MPPKKDVATKGVKGKAKAVAKEEKKQQKVAKTQPKGAAKPVEKLTKKEKRAKKPVGAPKKPMSAFFCYQQARREPLKNEAPQLNHRDIVKRMSEEWKAMNDAQKLQFVNQSNDARELYKVKMTDFKAKQAKIAATAGASTDNVVGKKRPASAAPEKGSKSKTGTPAKGGKVADAKKGGKAGKGSVRVAAKPAAKKTVAPVEHHVNAEEGQKKKTPMRAQVVAEDVAHQQIVPPVGHHDQNGNVHHHQVAPVHVHHEVQQQQLVHHEVPVQHHVEHHQVDEPVEDNDDDQLDIQDDGEDEIEEQGGDDQEEQ